jgi:hypothetical protein
LDPRDAAPERAKVLFPAHRIPINTILLFVESGVGIFDNKGVASAASTDALKCFSRSSQNSEYVLPTHKASSNTIGVKLCAEVERHEESPKTAKLIAIR